MHKLDWLTIVCVIWLVFLAAILAYVVFHMM
jgi:hypothetical protein